MNRIKYLVFLLAAAVFLSAPVIADANPIIPADYFTDIKGQGLDPGDSILVDEHGGIAGGPWWGGEEADLQYTFNASTLVLGVDITNKSDHTMYFTVLAFEQNAWDWKGSYLAADTWDGVDGSNDAAYYFGTIAPEATSHRDINFKAELPEPIYFDSKGLDSESDGSNVSITHAPEPVSSMLFISGAAMLGFRRFRKT